MSENWYPTNRPEHPTEPADFPSTGRNSLARFGLRAAARVIDSALIGVPVLLLGLVVVLGVNGADPAEPVTLPRWTSAVWFVLVVVYETVLVAWRGQTLGKMMVGIKVGRLDNGRPPLWWQAAIRIALPATAAALPLEWAMVVYSGVYSTVWWNPLRRGVHDQAGGTVVVASR